MPKKLIIIICLFAIAIAAKAEDPKIESKVQKVIVFLNGAQVTRTASASIAAGNSTLVFTGISPNIDIQSLQVHAAGDFTILSVKTELNFLSEIAKQKNIEELRAFQKALNNKIAYQSTLMAVNQAEENMLMRNQLVTGQNASLDVLKLKQALDFQTARLTEIKKKTTAINEQMNVLNEELNKYNKQIAELQKGTGKVTNNVLVTVSSKSALQSAFTLSYLVNNASWYPTYDIRAKNVNSPITIAYKANVTQQSGEDWKNIKLTLSSGNPTVSGSKPTLEPYYVNFGMYYSGQATITQVKGRVTDGNGEAIAGVTVRIKGTSIGTQSDVDGRYVLQVPAGGNQFIDFSSIGFEATEQPINSNVINVTLRESSGQLNEVVVTGYAKKDNSVANAGRLLQGRVAGLNVSNTRPIAMQQTENQTNVEFNIDNPYTIPSDGKQYQVEINQVELAAAYQYYTAPKISTDVFLTATLINWNKYNFLSGEANLFFEGTYIGKSLLNTQVATDTLSLSLGADKNIVVTRTLQKELTDKQTFGANKKDTRSWLINVKNRKSQPIDLLIEDQVPVSQNSSIEVETQEVSGGNVDKLPARFRGRLH